MLPGRHTIFPNPFISYSHTCYFIPFLLFTYFQYLFPRPHSVKTLLSTSVRKQEIRRELAQIPTITFALCPAYAPTYSVFLPVTINELSMLLFEVTLSTSKLGIISSYVPRASKGHLSSLQQLLSLPLLDHFH